MFNNVKDQATQGETNKWSKYTCHKHYQINGVENKIFFWIFYMSCGKPPTNFECMSYLAHSPAQHYPEGGVLLHKLKVHLSILLL